MIKKKMNLAVGTISLLINAISLFCAEMAKFPTKLALKYHFGTCELQHTQGIYWKDYGNLGHIKY